MLTRRGLFIDIAKQFLAWGFKQTFIPEARLQQQLETLPRVTHYSLHLNPMTQWFQITAQTPHGPRVITRQGQPLQTQSLAETHRRITSLARQVVSRLPLGDHFRSESLVGVLDECLRRCFAEHLTLVVDITSNWATYQLGLSLISRHTQRTLVAEAYTITPTAPSETPMTPEVLEDDFQSLFHHFHRHYRGDSLELCYRSPASLEALVYNRQALKFPKGCWPMVAFTALPVDGRPARPGLGLKTNKGWIVILKDPEASSERPYCCHHIPSPYQQQLAVYNEEMVGEEILSLLLNVGLLRQVANY